MNYELAKKLKDAGFPEICGSGLYFDSKQRLVRTLVNDWSNGKEHHTTMVMGIDSVYVPTLSELIEACGDDFYQLDTSRSGVPYKTNWYATGKVISCVSGDTPEEAVSHLWLLLLLLNKK